MLLPFIGELIVPNGHSGGPFAPLQLLQHAGHALLASLGVVELAEEELDVLLELARGRGRIGLLHHRADGDVVLLKLLGDVDGISARAREAVGAVDDDARDLLLGFFHKGEHAVELLSLVGLGALVGAPEVLDHL
ncbi:hypothetical protein GU926_11350 [Nibribacter ruber]|uniref:Uncharacterized protein n=1 Tax=Nibribacter ruber TaxID=2698458 RepID=A0A6P1P1X4_9BACT|nr:hypothetical protein [Nibribacter ruber]QHL87992.1 hypothetical protein GU926_11350 [Nibribacter ruber]